MRNYFSKLILGTCLAGTFVLTGCLDETLPTSGATEDQMNASAKATEARMWAIPATMNYFAVLSEDHWDYGYSSIMHIRDLMTADMPVTFSNYNQYSVWERNRYQGEKYLYNQFVWTFYYQLVLSTNKLIGGVNPDNANATELGYLGVGYAYRALAYLDMARMFEFLENDKTSNINAAGNDVLNLTVPIVTDSVSEDSARNNPRATRIQMAKFISDDLDKAEKYIKNFSADKRSTKAIPDLACVYGLRARLYMWLEDYQNAAIYARKAIDSGIAYRPVTEEEWLNTSSGFNDMTNKAWMWGEQFAKEDNAVATGIVNWTSFMSCETTYGYAGGGGVKPMIDAKLYNSISNDDFRKLSWKAPKTSDLYGKNTYCDNTIGESLPDYASLKFRPGSGNTTLPSVASATAYPLMRIEEMYFIEAEATAHLNPVEGRELIVDFMKNYRYSSYTTSASAYEDVIDEIFKQKRVEFWGEGIIFFDYKRLNKAVDRAYPSTRSYENNWRDDERFRTTTRPAWMNFCIVQTEKNNNSALMGFENPDPSDLYELITVE